MISENRLDSLDKAIIATLVYAQIKQWPLTTWEIFQYLINPRRISGNYFLKENGLIRLRLIYNHLERLAEKGIIFERDGFYGLRKLSRNDAAKKRIQHDKTSDKKIKRARRIINYLKYFPFVRGIFLSGSLAFGWARRGSDIDLLIITTERHLWTVRFFLSGLLIILGLKRSKQKIEDRLCLNHFITAKTLKIPLYSLYNAQTYSHLIPLFGEDALIKSFFKQNAWLKQYLFLARETRRQEDLRRKQFGCYGRIIQGFFELVLIFLGGGLLEQFLRRIQIYYIKKNPLTYQRGGRVVVDEAQIEFHPNSPEKKVIKKYNRILSRLNLFSFKPEHDSGLC